VFNLNKDEHSNGCEPQNHGNPGRQRSTSSRRLLFGDVQPIKKSYTWQLPTPDELERRELAVRRARNRLLRQAAELNSLKEELNKSVQEYNKCVEKFKEKKRKLDQTVDRIQVREDFLKGREQLMEDFEDNITLAQLQRQLILAE
jgi:hypothetical protein